MPDAGWLRKARAVVPETKRTLSFRAGPGVLAWFWETGRGYQTRINAVLRAFVEAQPRRRD